jgi:cytidylate kinase
MQRHFAKSQRAVVTEGRDQGTVAFPDADYKFFLTANIAERARRRHSELSSKGVESDLDQIEQSIRNRDQTDQSRDIGPLKPAADAMVIDTTDLCIYEVVEKLLGVIEADV